jgi:hypothetical protein
LEQVKIPELSQLGEISEQIKEQTKANAKNPVSLVRSSVCSRARALLP